MEIGAGDAVKTTGPIWRLAENSRHAPNKGRGDGTGEGEGEGARTFTLSAVPPRRPALRAITSGVATFRREYSNSIRPWCCWAVRRKGSEPRLESGSEVEGSGAGREGFAGGLDPDRSHYLAPWAGPAQCDAPSPFDCLELAGGCACACRRAEAGEL